MGKPNENKKKGIKSTARREKKTHGSYLRRKGGMHVSNESGWELLRYRTWHRKRRRKYKHMEKMENKLTD